MKKVPFIKMQGAGNDFALVDGRRPLDIALAGAFARRICDRKFGAGADGLLVMRRTEKADVRMQIFNADGSEAEMCGNGARCLALVYARRSGMKDFAIETRAGVLEARIVGPATVALHLPDPTDIRLDVMVRVGKQTYEVDFVNTGVPHAVVEVADLESVPVMRLGRAIRSHGLFQPAGTNVDFVRVRDSRRIDIRTYERGVEDETLACGTGSVAGAIASALNHTREGLQVSGTRAAMRHRIQVRTKGGEELTVAFAVTKHDVSDVWLEGRAKIVYEGVYHV